MPDKKLTDSEIVNALQKEIQDSKRINSSYALLNLNLLKETVDLITRLQAENENYSKNNQQMTSDILKLYKELEQAKAENKRLKNAYKQCAWQRDCFEADNKRLYEIIENKI